MPAQTGTKGKPARDPSCKLVINLPGCAVHSARPAGALTDGHISSQGPAKLPTDVPHGHMFLAARSVARKGAVNPT